MDMGEQLRVIQVDEETSGEESRPVKTPSEVLAEIIAAADSRMIEPAPTGPASGESRPPG